jgi:hypothetical protein
LQGISKNEMPPSMGISYFEMCHIDVWSFPMISIRYSLDITRKSLFLKITSTFTLINAFGWGSSWNKHPSTSVHADVYIWNSPFLRCYLTLKASLLPSIVRI